MDIGKTIKKIRQSQSYNQSELAELAGITQTSLSQIESGKKRPNKSTLDKICEVLKINEPALFILSMSKDDIPLENRENYEKIFPSIKEMLEKMFIVK